MATLTRYVHAPRPADAIDCPTCERMGRVTVIMPNGRLTTATCDVCQGEGFIVAHDSRGCQYCEHASAGMMRATPMFEAPAWGGF